MNPEKPQEKILFPEIALEIKKMIDADQAMRERNLESGDTYWDDELDIVHTRRMKEIVALIGFPTASKVGKEVSNDAWLLVQHADHDIEFQTICLTLMKESSEGEVERRDIAFLEDRIRVNQGRGQLYGTQFMQVDGRHVPRPIEDEENIDARRAEMGMGTLAERIEEMYRKYPFADEKK